MSTGSYSDNMTPSELTQQTALSDLTQQKGLLIGIGLALVAVLFISRRRGSDTDQRKAARHLVRDWGTVDDVGDARTLLASNLGPIVRPVLLLLLSELENQAHRYLRRAEKSIARL
jgi:hypothetical protein